MIYKSRFPSKMVKTNKSIKIKRVNYNVHMELL
nr:MAG TPA: hypothetical protein [Caudoviricetes sp.]